MPAGGWRGRRAGFFCRGWRSSPAFALCGCPKKNVCDLKTRLSDSLFPALDEISREIENEGFAHVNDAGWDWEDYRQFFRLFYKTDDRAQATICLNEQHDLSFYYLRISSRAKTA
jgi:hypothetical protein